MNATETDVPAWCRVGTYAVVTDGTYDARGMWRAVQITEINGDQIHVRATRPHTGHLTFKAQGVSRRPWNSKSKWELAPADGPQVAGQRAAIDEAKHGVGWREWVLTDEGSWRPERKRRVTGPGRPAIGPKVEVRLPHDVLAALDVLRGELAGTDGSPKSQAQLIRQLLETHPDLRPHLQKAEST